MKVIKDAKVLEQNDDYLQEIVARLENIEKEPMSDIDEWLQTHRGYKIFLLTEEMKGYGFSSSPQKSSLEDRIKDLKALCPEGDFRIIEGQKKEP